MSETADVHPKSLYLHDNRSAKSIMSYIEPNRSDVHMEKEKGPYSPLHNSSKSGLKSYLMKRVVKKKSDEERANSYWPVNESGSMPSLITGRRMHGDFYSQKMQRICSEGDLRLLRKQWGESNGNGEPVGGNFNGFSGDSEDTGGLREHLFHRIVKKKRQVQGICCVM
jgi:hypothetical protein